MGSQRVGRDLVTEQQGGREGVTQTELVGGAHQGPHACAPGGWGTPGAQAWGES